jgi:hypothetical protein
VLSDVYRMGTYDFTVIGHTGKLDPDGTPRGLRRRQVREVDQRHGRRAHKKAARYRLRARKALYDEVLQIMATEVPFLYLAPLPVVGFRKNVVDSDTRHRHLRFQMDRTEVNETDRKNAAAALRWRCLYLISWESRQSRLPLVSPTADGQNPRREFQAP